MTNQKSILGIGSALVDILIKLENDTLLENLNLPKGSMTLVNSETSKNIIDITAKLNSEIVTGGSAANTIRGIAQLGGETAFIGKINNDKMGNFFKTTLQDLGIKFHNLKGNIPSGVAATLISKDSERTFATYLGAASELTLSDISENFLIPYNYLHVEGYLVFNHELIEGILKLAKKHQLKVSLDMASFNVVEANKEFITNLINNYVDIVFANEEEAKAYTGKEPEKALEEISEQCEIAIVKLGSKGSIVKAGSKKYIIDAYKVKSVDTTGAGDVYASGFLYGLANNMKLDKCGKIGSLLASEVIKVIGAKIPNNAWQNINLELDKLK